MDPLEEIKRRRAAATTALSQPPPNGLNAKGQRLELIYHGAMPATVDFLLHSAIDMDWLIAEVERLRTRR